MTSVEPGNASASEQLIDHHLPVYDLALTEHLVIDADADAVYRAAKDLDFLSVRSPLVAASLFLRGLPARLRGRAVTPPPQLRLASGDRATRPGERPSSWS